MKNVRAMQYALLLLKFHDKTSAIVSNSTKQQTWQQRCNTH